MPETATAPTPRTGAIDIGAFVEVAITGHIDRGVYPGLLAAADDRGIVVAPSDKQLAANPDTLTPQNVTFFPWHSIAFISAVREA